MEGELRIPSSMPQALPSNPESPTLPAPCHVWQPAATFTPFPELLGLNSFCPFTGFPGLYFTLGDGEERRGLGRLSGVCAVCTWTAFRVDHRRLSSGVQAIRSAWYSPLKPLHVEAEKPCIAVATTGDVILAF